MPISDQDRIYEEAMALPEDKRLALATRLLESVEHADDPQWNAAWMAELDRRMDLVERGEVELEEWETVRETLLREAREIREH